MSFNYQEILEFLRNKSISEIAQEKFGERYYTNDHNDALSDLFKVENVQEDERKELNRFMKSLDNIFMDKLRPFPTHKGDKHIFCKMIQDEEIENSGDEIVFFALTEEMKDADQAFFGDRQGTNLIDVIYKPYLYEAVVNGKPGKVKSKKWYKVRVSRRDDNCIIDGDTYGGFLHYSASPRKTMAVIFEEWEEISEKEIGTALDLTPSEICSSNDKDIENELREIFDNVCTSEIEIYKLGQANYVHGINTINDVKREFLFDCGFPQANCLAVNNEGNIDYKESKICKKHVDKIDSCNPKLIMISHWHADHYNAAFMLARRVFNDAKWIVPYYYVVDNCSKRLVKYLIFKDKILFSGLNDKVYSVGDYNISLIKPDSDRKKMNNCGFMLKTNSAIFPGDCECKHWTDNFVKNGNKIKHICIPHHASSRVSKKSKKKIISIINEMTPVSREREKAFVCVGKNNYNHPSNETLEKYEDLGFKIVRTDNIYARTKFVDK